jgi:hypothetical protein
MGVKKDKPYNNGTMTSAGFWGMIRSKLRQASRWWKPVAEAKKLARRLYKGKNNRQKWEYQCNHCKSWFMDKEIAVDHIEEVGTLKSGDDLKGFIERLFCEVDGLQVLCNKRKDGKKSCHKIKTENYMRNGRN